MSEEKTGKQSAKPGDESFGSGLGADFKPLGKRVLVGPGRDHQKLIVRCNRQGKNGVPKHLPQSSQD